MRMDSNKGKSVTTSVPSIAIKFHANAEQVEELYASDEEVSNKSEKISANTIASSSGEPDSSPLKYFPRLIKRSTSIDVSNAPLDSSPPSDPWKFFSDIRGKITKSVEEKFTEIKQRNQEDSSPSKGKLTKDSKESSSLSDSEDLSESSISRTCGFISTTEGVEMSSEDETPSFDKDKNKDENNKTTPEEKSEPTPTASAASTGSRLRYRFRLLKNKKAVIKEGSAIPENDDVESAVDALEDNNLNTNDIITRLAGGYENLHTGSEDLLEVHEMEGREIRERLHSSVSGVAMAYSPSGHVDLREPVGGISKIRYFLYIITFCVVFYLVCKVSTFVAGLCVGIFIGGLYSFLHTSSNKSQHSLTGGSSISSVDGFEQGGNKILEVPAADELCPVDRFEGWMNEFPEEYDFNTYHISMTQSVFIRLQGNLLRISHARAKIPKRALWNEPKLKPQFVYHRVYDLLGAEVCLLPEGLNYKRHWSKKYPICITLTKEQPVFDEEVLKKFKTEEEALESEKASIVPEEDDKKKKTKKEKQKKNIVLTQRFSKLNEEDEYEDAMPSTSRPTTPTQQVDSEDPHQATTTSDETKDSEKETEPQDDDDSLDEWGIFPSGKSPHKTKIYLFGRTDREKEDWYRKFTRATHLGAGERNVTSKSDKPMEISDTLLDRASYQESYYKFMLLFNQVVKSSNTKTEESDIPSPTKPPGKTAPAKKVKLEKEKEKPEVDESQTSKDSSDELGSEDVLWFNALIGRILFDCMRDPNFTLRVKERIQRKLAAIKLPYFIAELQITELNLGNTPPLIRKVYRPVLDERGLWIDLDITYDGLVVCTLQTQLNLMKLKHPEKHRGKPPDEKQATFNSDVDDSGESSSDEDMDALQATMTDNTFVAPVGGTSNTSKKFIKIVDKIADSKFFQAATENRYIKRAMEGVSNTDLRLRVTFKSLEGTLVLNIPPPPSNRIFMGFRPLPKLNVTARPIVGERNITFLRVTSWIEQQIGKEFQKIFVIPNMEDVVIPVMCPDLPQ